MVLTRAAFIDKQILFVQGLTALLEKTNYPAIKVIGHYTKGNDFVEKDTEKVDLIFLDINLGDEDGMEFVPKIKKTDLNIKLIVLTSYGDYRYVKDAMQRGADGFILKSADYSELATCIDEVMDGNTYIGDGLSISPPLNSFKKGFGVERKCGRDRLASGSFRPAPDRCGPNAVQKWRASENTPPARSDRTCDRGISRSPSSRPETPGTCA